jgi:hypothetical protein
MRRFVTIGLICAVALFVITGGAEAQFKGEGKYQASLIENNTFGFNPTCGGGGANCVIAGFSFPVDKEKSKVQVKPSGTDGDGGVTTKLLLSSVDCPGELLGNDLGVEGKCGPKDTPIVNHVAVLNTTAVATTTRVGLMFDLKQGKGIFQANGKNKVGGAELAGPLVTVVFKQPLFVNSVEIREPGTDVAHPDTGCGVIPLPLVDTCSNGTMYARTGIRVGEDVTLSCATTADCDDGGANPTLICIGIACQAEPCTVDADCDQNGGGSGGTDECGSGGTCCNPATDPTCAGQVP